MIKANVTKTLFWICIGIWSLISFTRTMYNVSKIFTEENKWVYLTQDQKRKKIFGEVYSFYTFVKDNTNEKSKILFLSPSGKTYYLARYYLYPRIIIYQKDIQGVKRELAKNSQYNYLMVLLTNDPDLHENKFVEISNTVYGEPITFLSRTIYPYKGYIYKL